MRLILAILGSLFFLSPQAQTLQQPVSHLPVNQQSVSQKWYFSKYAGLSAGYSSFAGGTSFLAAPVGLQLSRRLNDNLYAFTGISAAPVIFNANRFITGPVLNPSYPGHGLPPYPGNNLPNGYGFGLNSRVEAGLMYVNDAKTFSISGSVGIERNSYPVYPSNRVNTKKQ